MATHEKWNWIQHPTLLLKGNVAKANIKRMAEKAKRLGLRFRPHYKTHQSAEIGEWFRAEGVEAITVSSIEMAEYFANAGWKDILIAFPVNLRAVASLNALARRVRLGLVIADIDALLPLAGLMESPVDIWVEVDSGDRRSGFNFDNSAGILAVVRALPSFPNLRFAGLMGHGGFTYRSQGLEEIHNSHSRDLQNLMKAKQALLDAKIEGFQVSTGDTPACSREESYAGADEIRPGNFVFYDVQQQHIGSCGFEHLAVALACPVVAVYPHRGEVIVHGGGVHLGKDSLVDAAYGQHYGRVAILGENGWEMPEMGCYLRSISQEHGVAVMRPDLIGQIKVGDLLAVLPVHSCMSADLMMRLHDVDSAEPQRPILMMKAQQGAMNLPC